MGITQREAGIFRAGGADGDGAGLVALDQRRGGEGGEADDLAVGLRQGPLEPEQPQGAQKIQADQEKDRADDESADQAGAHNALSLSVCAVPAIIRSC